MTMPIRKNEIFDICNVVANKFKDMTFSSGVFSVNITRFARTQINPGLGFKYGKATLNPSISIKISRIGKLLEKFSGMGEYISIINFQTIKLELSHFPLEKVGLTYIVREIPSYVAQRGINPASYTILSDLDQLLTNMVVDGARLLNELYDFSSEQAFLEKMPPNYRVEPLKIPIPNYVGIPYTEYERGKGIIMCLVKMNLGDFDFVKLYESDHFNPFMYKSLDKLERVKEAIPELNEKYLKTGRIY